MIPITPVTAETCSPYIGRPVCAVMQDGTHHYGILRGIGDGQLYLERGRDELALASLRDRSKAQPKPAAKAHTKAFYGYGLGYGAFAISLALLAALFFVPWFFI